MLKKPFLITFIFFLSFVNNALAHTGLESSSPQDGEVINEELQQVSLTFETKIEQSSTFELQNSNGKTIPVGNISISENQLIGNVLTPLENEEYKVIWKIIGADGHPIDGEFSFSVNVPVTEEPAEEQIQPQEKTYSQSNVEENELDSKIEELDKEIHSTKIPSYVFQWMIGVLIVIVVVSFLLIMRRKE